jgi:DNA polymerase-3 subunit epsilon
VASSDAPSFGEIAIELSEILHGHVLVAHNLNSFDKPILAAHFEGTPEIRIDLGLGIDTMPIPKVKLAELCAIHGVKLELEYAHSAMGDTRALAEVFQKGLAYLTKQTRAVQADPQTNSTPISTRKKVRIKKH